VKKSKELLEKYIKEDLKELLAILVLGL